MLGASPKGPRSKVEFLGQLALSPHTVVKVVMCSRGRGSASEVETHKNIDSVLHTKTTFQAHSIFSVSIQK